MLPLGGRSTAIFVVTTIFLGISFISVSLRCFVRLWIVRAFGWDDAMMVFAMMLNILFAVCGIIGALYGIGQKFAPLFARGTTEAAMFWWWLGQCSYVWVVVIARLAIAMALLRLTVSHVHRLILYASIGVTSIVSIVFWFMLTLQCQPVSYFWQRVRLINDPMTPIHGSCMNLNRIIAMAYVYSGTAAACDFTLGLLPFWIVWKLQMNRGTKAALAGILGMGCVASAAVIIRIPYLKDYNDPDFLYATANISIWSNIEASLGIAAGSMVTVRPLSRWFRDSRNPRYRMRADRTPIVLSAVRSASSSAPQYWRSDIEPEGVLTTVQTSDQPYRISSQETLNPHEDELYHGVNVRRMFVVSANAKT
ncbi:hypothetical protein N7474_008310 [Penicillium riverlandense]|uniref:uncharacterized protein n=1 Tax=Penicillium riverlandense TaxID=1903569 RepID=UPI002548ED76|nr:uncharacterized protein N7474_008310 [Penicillium riverlandense]KAJ5812009.1 hypothetical protein N7474_008310 [Penicillium riverlandense]